MRLMDYAIIRAVPDIARGEMLNIGLVAIYGDQVYCRVAPPTRCLESMLTADEIQLIAAIPEQVTKPAGGFPALNQDGNITVSQRPSLGYLEFLRHEPPFGFFVDAPRQAFVDELRADGSYRAFEGLFSRLVMPPQKPIFAPSKPSKARAKTLVYNLIDNAKADRARIVTNVRVRNAKSNSTYDVDFAFANGKATMGQTLDFDTRPETRERNTDHAIATIAEIEKLIGPVKQKWLSVVQIQRDADETTDLISRLKAWSWVVQLPADRLFFEQMLRKEATSDLRHIFSASGMSVLSRSDDVDDNIEIIANPTEELI